MRFTLFVICVYTEHNTTHSCNKQGKEIFLATPLNSDTISVYKWRFGAKGINIVPAGVESANVRTSSSFDKW